MPPLHLFHTFMIDTLFFHGGLNRLDAAVEIGKIQVAMRVDEVDGVHETALIAWLSGSR